MYIYIYIYILFFNYATDNTTVNNGLHNQQPAPQQPLLAHSHTAPTLLTHSHSTHSHTAPTLLDSDDDDDDDDDSDDDDFS
jgi:hypothetical protein